MRCDPIMAPWIILATDRTRLGQPVYAVREADRGGLRRTMRVERAVGFPTRRKAENAARKLAEGFAKVLFTAIRVGDGDFARPRAEPETRQTTAFGI